MRLTLNKCAARAEAMRIDKKKGFYIGGSLCLIVRVPVEFIEQ